MQYVRKIQIAFGNFFSHKIAKKIIVWGFTTFLVMGIFKETGFYAFLRDTKILLQERWKAFLLVFGMAAILANTSLDKLFYDYLHKMFNERVWLSNLLYIFKKLVDYGSALYVPILYGMLFASIRWDWPNLRAWTVRSIWSFFQGCCFYLLGTVILSSPRPEAERSSSWFQLPFFKYVTAISGHAFLGAFPFVALTNCVSGVFKLPLYILSWLPGLSRIQTASHYPSQVLLGWMSAFLPATRTTERGVADIGMPITSMVAAGESVLPHHQDEYVPSSADSSGGRLQWAYSLLRRTSRSASNAVNVSSEQKKSITPKST